MRGIIEFFFFGKISARYRNDVIQADAFYSIASKVLPGNGKLFFFCF